MLRSTCLVEALHAAAHAWQRRAPAGPRAGRDGDGARGVPGGRKGGRRGRRKVGLLLLGQTSKLVVPLDGAPAGGRTATLGCRPLQPLPNVLRREKGGGTHLPDCPGVGRGRWVREGERAIYNVALFCEEGVACLGKVISSMYEQPNWLSSSSKGSWVRLVRLVRIPD